MALKKKKTQPKKKVHEAVRKVEAEIVDHDHPIDTDSDRDADSYEPDEHSSEGPSNTNLVPSVEVERGIVSGKDPLALYLSEIRKYPLLSKEQELEIAKKYYETKDPVLAQTLVKSNLRFVVKVAAEYAKFSSRLIDVIQEGNVGLMHAVKEFNPYKGNRLITYAVWWIRGYIQEYLMRQFSMVRIGTTANQRKLFYQLQRQKEELDKMASPENVALLSHKLGIPEDEVSEMAKRLRSRDVSLDKPAGHEDDSATPLSSLLRKEDGSLPLDEQMALDEQLKILMNAVEKLKSTLTEKEKILLEERILSDEPLTLQEIGDKYKITREAVRQTEARLMKKIKETMIS
jgi:RNA polymerase sigma-32 factor